MKASGDPQCHYVYSASYTPFGQRTVVFNTTGFNIPRGYTMHEHLDEFVLINMNARLYDPYIARFLSPDPYIQDPENSQNFNRYPYCLNNPLKYTDPSGEFWMQLGIGMVFGAVTNGWASKMSGGKFWDGAWRGAISSGLSYATCNFMPKFGGIFTRGLAMSGVYVFNNGVTNALSNQKFFANWQISATMGFINGAIEGYRYANQNGKNLWWGNEIKYGRTKWSFFTNELPYETIEWDIPNNLSKYENDCVVTSILEADTFFKGQNTYSDIANDVKYIHGVGVFTNKQLYEGKLNEYFSSSNLESDVLENIQFMNDLKNQGNIINVYMPHNITKYHSDNIRSISYYHSGKIVIRLRTGTYNIKVINNQWNFYELFKLK